MKNIIIATENIGKLEEMKSLLGNTFEQYYCLKDFPEKVIVDEDGASYVANALKKARKIGDRFGITTLSDDSGLEVEALHGRPGVYSSRYGKDDNDRLTRLLGELQDIPFEQRKAIFKSYVVFYMPEQERCYVFYGDLKGYIGFERHGTGGFGYDPVFYEPHLKKYIAELSITEKNALSHRGKAVLALKNFLNVDFFRKPRVLNL
jgi:XTP/dITP diphosphohydrolase